MSDGLAAAGGSISDVRAVLVTHIHPDHYGLAGRVREASGAWIGLHPADAVMLESRYGDTDELVANMFRFLADSGVPDDRLPDLALASMALKSMVTMAEPDVLFEDGREIDLPGWPLRTIWTPGHSPGHVCFFSEDQKLLISGDHVLPRITPNISVHAQQFSNPLGDYLDSLRKVQDLGTEEVLPAHEYRFSDLDGRVEEIITHHADRLDEIEQVLTEHPGSTAWEITLASPLVATVGRDRVVHATPGQRRDAGPLRPPRAAGSGPPPGDRSRPGSSSSTADPGRSAGHRGRAPSGRARAAPRSARRRRRAARPIGPRADRRPAPAPVASGRG